MFVMTTNLYLHLKSTEVCITTKSTPDSLILKDQAPVVQRPDNFIRWIRYYSGSKIYFTLNVVQGFRTLPNLAVVGVCIFACKRGNTEIFAQIETVG